MGPKPFHSTHNLRFQARKRGINHANHHGHKAAAGISNLQSSSGSLADSFTNPCHNGSEKAGGWGRGGANRCFRSRLVLVRIHLQTKIALKVKNKNNKSTIEQTKLRRGVEHSTGKQNLGVFQKKNIRMQRIKVQEKSSEQGTQVGMKRRELVPERKSASRITSQAHN